MTDGEDWLFRPVQRGMCLYTDIITPGVLDLDDIATMNEIIDVSLENEMRAEEFHRRDE